MKVSPVKAKLTTTSETISSRTTGGKSMGRLHFNSIKKTEAEIPLAALQKLAADKGSQFWYFLAEVFDNLHQGVIVADQSGLVVIFNKKAEQIMGYSAAEVLGRSSLWDFCEECDRPPLFRESLSNGQSFPEEEVEMSGRNGTIGVRVTALYGSEGRLEGALATLRSLDEVRQREKEQKNLVRLAAIGRIISAVAHEINNPLQTVRTSLELALDPRKSTERRRDYLQAADQEISRISRIIGQMRSFYRPTPGEKQATVVNAKLQEAITLLEKPLGEAGVQVEFDLAEHLPEVNLIDYQLEQVFLNLILNALEEMPENSKLYISSRLEETDRIAISFRYKAPQSGRVELDHLFDPLANRRSHALGIGLSVCREIISELGGTIEATTNGGLTLTVYLPL